MRRITSLTGAEVIDYHLRDGGEAVAVFADSQPARVDLARVLIMKLLERLGRPAVIWEPGCSTGDISGWFSNENVVTGIDMVPAAVRLARERYPKMTVLQEKAESVEPTEMDVLVMTEFLEHIDDPLTFTKEWMAKTKYAIIGHPLNDPGTIEPGHAWSYDLYDFKMWFSANGFDLLEFHLFSLGSFPEMVMGIGARG